jgi:uncharacterized protein
MNGNERESDERPMFHLARIEVGPGELSRLLEAGVSSQVADALKKIGYAHVTVDLQGYRRGSLNEPASKVGQQSAH